MLLTIDASKYSVPWALWLSGRATHHSSAHQALCQYSRNSSNAHAIASTFSGGVGG